MEWKLWHLLRHMYQRFYSYSCLTNALPTLVIPCVQSPPRLRVIMSARTYPCTRYAIRLAVMSLIASGASPVHPRPREARSTSPKSRRYGPDYQIIHRSFRCDAAASCGSVATPALVLCGRGARGSCPKTPYCRPRLRKPYLVRYALMALGLAKTRALQRSHEPH